MKNSARDKNCIYDCGMRRMKGEKINYSAFRVLALWEFGGGVTMLFLFQFLADYFIGLHGNRIAYWGGWGLQFRPFTSVVELV